MFDWNISQTTLICYVLNEKVYVKAKNLLCHGLDDALCLYKVCKHQSFIHNTIHSSSFFLWKSKNTLIKHQIWFLLLKTLKRNQLMIHLINILINTLIKPLRILPFIMVIKKKKEKKIKKTSLYRKKSCRRPCTFMKWLLLICFI